MWTFEVQHASVWDLMVRHRAFLIRIAIVVLALDGAGWMAWEILAITLAAWTYGRRRSRAASQRSTSLVRGLASITADTYHPFILQQRS